ncbi:AbrB/MazE/SpoVT family DNA-binding domain-containing protein [Clostridium sp. HBUAS56017]|uniref:AbrB/MazE/SpoVT family DNA-binding domain-containing protein n=1 Tax=Clostridium sp. HBUAS56017 TaxID=2571128 RepID=UPI0011782E91|nr:AbrB/MazE/SpoVT family DNA-binding domain-containing protein [Clostridium sp. HBUAS56017]
MKATGIVRRVDELGRITIPMELCKSMDIKRADKKGNGTPMEIYTEGKNIIIRKYEPGCHICGNAKNLTRVLDMDLCPTCLADVKLAIKKIEEKGLLNK